MNYKPKVVLKKLFKIDPESELKEIIKGLDKDLESKLELKAETYEHETDKKNYHKLWG